MLFRSRLDSRDPIAAVEWVHNGRIERITLPARVTIRESGWFLIRAVADVTNTFRFASTAPWYVEIGGRPMVPQRESARYFVDWCRERLDRFESVPALTQGQKEELRRPWRACAPPPRTTARTALKRRQWRQARTHRT